MNHNHDHISTTITIATRRAEGAVLAYANFFTASHKGRIVALRFQTEGVAGSLSDMPSAGNGCIRDALTRIAKEEKVGLIVSEWLPNPCDMQELLRLAHEIAVPAIFFRDPERKPYRRIIVATAGGPNVLQQMWVARQMACALSGHISAGQRAGNRIARQTACALCLPVSFLRVMHPAGISAASPFDDPATALDACSCRLLHMVARMEVKKSLDVAGTIAGNVREGDLLVLGAPSALRITSDFEGSLPHTIADRLSTPLILLSTPPDNRLRLRRLFWGGLIQTNLRPHDKKHAIVALIENLARHNQIAHSCVADILELAMRREGIMSTAVDCETAFPHVTLPGFMGVAGSMAICPEGVAFDSPDGRPTRFIFLLVTPDSLCDEYLATIGMIARRMLRAEVRSALLRCRTPAEALDILEPGDA